MEKGYYRAAWNDIKNSPGWFGKLCLLALIECIPIFGLIVNYGYQITWAREIAWDLNRPMPAKIFGNEDGKLYRRGWFALVIGLVMAIVPCIIYALAVAANGGVADNWNLLSAILMVVYVLSLFAFGLAALVGCMRMTIYDSLSAGLGFKQIWKMMKHDANGMFRILGMQLLLMLIFGAIFCVITFAVVFFVFVAAGAASAAAIGSGGAHMGFFEMGFFSLLTFAAPVMIAIAYFCMVANVFIEMVTMRAVGYWTRNFQVNQWGDKDAPLPFEVQQRESASQAH